MAHAATALLRQPLGYWVIYHRPYQVHPYEARKFILSATVGLITDDKISGFSLASVRKRLPDGLARFPRTEDDDPDVAETWG
jgi:hypothetical protein